jgi:hypothetical protein
MLCTGTKNLASILLDVGFPIQILEDGTCFKRHARFLVGREEKQPFPQDSMSQQGRSIVQDNQINIVSPEQVRQIAQHLKPRIESLILSNRFVKAYSNIDIA